MKYRILKNKSRGYNFSQFFRTKKEAVAFQAEHGGQLQRKIGGDWFDC